MPSAGCCTGRSRPADRRSAMPSTSTCSVRAGRTKMPTPSTGGPANGVERVGSDGSATPCPPNVPPTTAPAANADLVAPLGGHIIGGALDLGLGDVVLGPVGVASRRSLPEGNSGSLRLARTKSDPRSDALLRRLVDTSSVGRSIWAWATLSSARLALPLAARCPKATRARCALPGRNPIPAQRPCCAVWRTHHLWGGCVGCVGGEPSRRGGSSGEMVPVGGFAE
jgi:hypothetical protein